jgi:hypothetical protein
MTLPVTSFLRRALTVDALMTGATGLLLLIGAGMLASLLDVPEPLLRYSGLALIPFALYVGLVARRDRVPRTSIVAIILSNAAWVAASAWLALGSTVRPNALGYAFIVVQAIAVAAFAELQYVGLRRAGVTRTV